MTDNQKELMAIIVLIGSFVIPEIDEAYITSKMKETGHKLEVQCHDDPKNCWIQKGRAK